MNHFYQLLSIVSLGLGDGSSWDLYTEVNGTSLHIILIICIEGMSPCFRTRTIGKTLTRVTAGTREGVREREIKSYRGLHRHDRSCLEMSEADGVDGGAICKRGFIHLQFAEKLEAPEAERHLGSWILE
ncbi:hypothetical protein V1477_018931 [Vespula maculifrons]|uniref:Uncharacterized protein n=1 Tax=Vespula maculifrons TaxID=7453 RepID=A0ABD2ASW2_VESMC